MSEWQFVLAFWSVSFFALLCVWCLVDIARKVLDAAFDALIDALDEAGVRDADLSACFNASQEDE